MNKRQYKLSLLESKIERELKKEFGTWEDGTSLIEAMLVDRDTHEMLHYAPIPYWYKADKDKRKEILRLLRMNLAIAYNAMELAWNLNDYSDEEEQ